MLSSDTQSWNDARKQCQKLDKNYDLVTIHNDEENAALASKATGYPWIGFNDIASEGNFAWVGGSNNSYGAEHKKYPWSVIEPNNAGVYILAKFPLIFNIDVI